MFLRIGVGLVVRFVFSQPDGRIAVELRRQPIEFTTGESTLRPDVVFIPSGDRAHLLCLGELDLATAMEA